MTQYTLSDFNYHLPDELIAQQPLKSRSDSRLFCLRPSKNSINHLKFNEIVDFINPEDLIIFNDTKVIPARLFGLKSTGGKVECLIERILNDHQALAHIKASKAPKAGMVICFESQFEATVIGRSSDLFIIEINEKESILDLLNKYGSIPLPGYIHREAAAEDRQRYQTVYAKYEGAVAAPTAGLHFDQKLLDQIRQKGVATATVTLHVGAGTFQPVRVDNFYEHKMHSEWMEVSEEVCEAVRACRQRGGRVFAVGTTTVRCLETAAQDGELQVYSGDTDIFIYPGFQFRCVDALITNFHLPQSTLMMLVTAFGGYEFMMQAYRTAVSAQYRFYSYGDAMLILNK